MEFYVTNRDYRFIPSGLTRIIITSEITVETEEQWADIQKLIEKYIYGIADKKTNSETNSNLPQQELPTNTTDDESGTVFSTMDIE